ncbi:hypothetical protein AB0425_25655 [Actinosynnema sp. NPDC051121]
MTREEVEEGGEHGLIKRSGNGEHGASRESIADSTLTWLLGTAGVLSFGAPRNGDRNFPDP